MITDWKQKLSSSCRTITQRIRLLGNHAAFCCRRHWRELRGKPYVEFRFGELRYIADRVTLTIHGARIAILQQARLELFSTGHGVLMMDHVFGTGKDWKTYRETFDEAGYRSSALRVELPDKQMWAYWLRGCNYADHALPMHFDESEDLLVANLCMTFRHADRI